MIQSPAQVAEVAQLLAAQPIIAFDTEFIRERTFYPRLGLIQVADREKAWLIDPLALAPQDLEPLLAVWTDPSILKAAHAVEQDQECLYHAYGIVASPVLDTAIAASLTGRGDQIGLSSLLYELLGIRLPKGHTRTDWTKRPLPRAMAQYALEDVRHLVEVAEILLADLYRRDRRKWALQLSAEFSDKKRYEPNPDAIARRLAAGKRLDATEYAVLKELVRWREERVRQADLPRRWVAEDALLVKLAHARPARVEELSDFRGLGAKTLNSGAKQILRAIKRGIETPPEQLESPPGRTQADSDETPALSLLKCFLNLLAHELQVPSRLLVDPDDVVKLLRRRFQSVDELRRSGLLKEGAADLLGEELLAVLSGERALKLAKGRVERYTP